MRRLAAACCVVLSCTEPPAPAPSVPEAVGPAPLRRLSNGEYLHTLSDLFPDVAATLPPLPADLGVGFFDNEAQAQEPSDVRIARFETIAALHAQAAVATLAQVRTLTGCEDWFTPALATACGERFIDGEGMRVFRRPVTAEEHARLSAAFGRWLGALDFEGAVQLTLTAMLQSPQFLYRVELPGPPGEPTPVEPYAMASRLSYLLWESAPDQTLLDAAQADALRTPEQLRTQVTRLLADPRARRTLWSFHRQWLGLERVLDDEHTQRTAEVDPGWTPASAQAAARETQRFVEETMALDGTLSALLLSRSAWLDDESARLYGLSAVSGAVELPATERAGVLTRVAFLAGTSHRGATSPPIRGNAIALRLLCQLPNPPPPGVDLSPPKEQPGGGPKTNRTLFEERTAPPTCQGCHASLNGLGFGLEHYGAAGAYQVQERGLPIDARGVLRRTDVDGPFDGALELSQRLARSTVVQRCAAEQWVRYALGRAPVAVEGPQVELLTQRFLDSGGDVRALLTDIALSPTFRLRHAEATP
ncbi:MAG: DUF1592 domain-containing protein [Myxococcaceae bacterium]|nr:DUF1592 domain-containing protein [Myxococcaceae bacterium]